MSGCILYGIGVGPGDPELITVKGARLIREAQVVFVPTSRTGAESLARSIAAPYIGSEQRVVQLIYPTDRRGPRELETCWNASADEIAGQLPLGSLGVFLTEGDPMLYSTFIYTMAALQRRQPHIRVEVVPGVSSITAAAAAAAVPLATGAERLCVLPGDTPEQALRATLSTADTTVIMKLSAGSERVLNLLEELGLMETAVWVRRCGQPDQEIVRNARDLRGRRLDYFSLMIVKRAGE